MKSDEVRKSDEQLQRAEQSSTPPAQLGMEPVPTSDGTAGVPICPQEVIMSEHKHCVFCGEASSNNPAVSTNCTSKLNPLPTDTVGNKPHGFPVSNRERAKAAAERASKCAHEVEFFSCDDNGNITATPKPTSTPPSGPMRRTDNEEIRIVIEDDSSSLYCTLGDDWMPASL